jgi:hypothetical protein
MIKNELHILVLDLIPTEGHGCMGKEKLNTNKNQYYSLSGGKT